MAGGRGFGRLRRYTANRKRHSLRLATASSLLLSALVLLAIAPAALAETKPVNTGVPTISGTPREGTKLNATKGTWTGGGLSYAYQWQSCPPPSWECANIASATESSYIPVYADIGSKIRVIVTATNKIGSAEATSAQKEPVEPAPPKNKEPPVISGIAKEGQLLTVSTGVWEGSPALKYKYQWERCNTEGIGCIKLGEHAKQGETPKEEEEREQKEKETEKEEAEVEEGPKQHRYVVTQADIGHTLRATVTDTNLAGSKEARSEHTETVTDGPPVSVNLPTIAGDLHEGGTLTASEGTWRGTTPIEYTLKWESCNAEHVCTETSGQTHTLGEGDVGNTIRLTVTAHNAYGTVTASSVASPQVLHATDDFAVGWGEDYRSQLGTIYKNIWEASPVLVEGQTGISAVATGSGFFLALHNDGTVAAAGGDLYGELGDEGKKATWQKGVSHVAVRNLTEVRAVAADSVHALALRNDGTVWAWGTSAHGQLGNGRGGFEGETGESERKATEVTALKSAGVSSIATGGGSDFAVLSNGEVRAWGNNHYGQLGVAPWPEECKKLRTCEATSRKKPSQEVEEGKKRQVELTEHLCVGDAGWDLCSKVPRTVVEADGKTALTHVIAVSGGGEAAFALLEGGKVVSWGGDGKGQLGQHVEPGTGKIFGPTGPVMINATEALTHVVAIAGGYRHALALLEDGSVVGWGDNTYGALGALTGEECTSGGKKFPCSRYATALSLPGGVHATAIAAGTHTSAVLGTDGKVYTVGSDKFGQLGRGPTCENVGGRLGDTYTCYSHEWKAVPGLEHVQAISMNATSVIALLGHQASPPLPVIADEPLSKSLKLEWGLPESESATLLSYRVWEHPGDQEASEEGSGEEGAPGDEEEKQEELEKEQEETEKSEGTAPTNTTLPVIKVYEVVEGKKEPVRNEAAVGQLLEATSGNWSGTPTIEFEYQWLRCKSSKCTWIAGASQSAYEPTVEDIGYTIEVNVTAHNNVLPRGRVTSQPSPMVAAQGEKVQGRVTQVPLKGQNNLSLGSLEHVEYQLTLLARNPTTGGGRFREMLATPLP